MPESLPPSPPGNAEGREQPNGEVTSTPLIGPWRPSAPASIAERLAAALDRGAVRPGKLIAAAVVAVTVVAISWWLLRPPPPPIERTLPRARSADASPAPGLGRAAAPATAQAVADVIVHAAGAVARPGVYRVRAGARVDDLVIAAGGLGPGADANRLNLAAPLADGERVYVPHMGEVAVPDPVGPSAPTTGADQSAAGGGDGRALDGGGPIDLNTATAQQLDTLPGVGPATAQKILDYRREHGRFGSVDELLEVRGIGDAKLAELRSKVQV